MCILYPEVRGTVLCACECPNHSNSSTGLQHQQQQQQQQQQQLRVGSPESWRLRAAGGKPYSVYEQDVPAKYTQQQYYYSSTTVRKCNAILAIILTKWSLHFRTEYYEAVPLCSDL